jgi:hypothetical protein
MSLRPVDENVGLDLADAMLVYLAGHEGIHTVFTLDRRDFSVYCLSRNCRLTRSEMTLAIGLARTAGLWRLDERWRVLSPWEATAGVEG